MPGTTTLLWTTPAGRLRTAARIARRSLSTAARRDEIGGPASVRHALLRGIRSAGFAAVANPASSRVVGNVGVLSDPDALRWAIDRRRDGSISSIVAGPNIVFYPGEHGRLIADPNVDVIVTPARWVTEHFLERDPSLQGRIVEWAAGVDTDWWTPGTSAPGAGPPDIDVLVLDKAGQDVPAGAARRALTSLGLSSRFLRYGTFDRRTYRSLLRRSRLLLYLSENETQGLALHEAWSCDVPSVVWSPGTWSYGGHTYDRASSAPYLTAASGIIYADPEGVEASVLEALSRIDTFSPRASTLEQGFTLVESARRYLRLFGP